MSIYNLMLTVQTREFSDVILTISDFINPSELKC